MQMIFSAFVAAVGLSFMPTGPAGPPAEAPSRHIAFYATGSANWSMAAALGLILLVLTLMLYAVYNRLSREPDQAR